ncbi:hypothetical protein TNIN_119661 [Trichonephila inaurata madagascariensis]|uniref:Uncharacterized protein n=1 Tax=Trichonephila inaurata madagascariensis TaxID=2747483 RepID=A0A8X7BUC2_9ARAC|nr:hypothetical protein TNIN_119661 [Trichonephila inaurata madagascariensis]
MLNACQFVFFNFTQGDNTPADFTLQHSFVTQKFCTASKNASFFRASPDYVKNIGVEGCSVSTSVRTHKDLNPLSGEPFLFTIES